MNFIFVTAFYIYFRIICKICLASFDIKNSLSPKDSGSFISLYVQKNYSTATAIVLWIFFLTNQKQITCMMIVAIQDTG